MDHDVFSGGVPKLAPVGSRHVHSRPGEASGYVGGILSAVRALKNRLVPQGTQLRPVALGMARGIVVPLDFSQHSRLYLGLYEVELNRFLRAYCTPGMRSFDVGAQIGYDALLLAHLTAAPVISFEADASLADALRTTFAANGALGALISARHATIGRSTGVDGAMALDDVVFGEGFVPGLIKIDIDGGEVDALQGAQRTLRELRPHLIVETHSAELERACGLLMRGRGYRPKIIHQRLVCPDFRPTAHNRWLVAAGDPQVVSAPSSE